MLGGVAGGLGRYFNIDPVIFRIGAVALTLAGGIGIFLYLAALLFVPSEEGDGTAPAGKPGRGRTVLAAVVLGIATLALLAQGPFGAGFFFAPLIVIGLVAAAIWWLLGGRGGAGRGAGRIFARLALGVAALAGAAVLFFASGWAAAAGGGAAIAMLVIVAGALLSVAAFRGGARWLIVPALLLAAPVGIVSAADVELNGGYGDRAYRPTTMTDLPERYRLAAGSLEVDLREIGFPAGRTTELRIEVGLGRALLVVPENVCAVVDGGVGAGYLRIWDGDEGGFNVGVPEGLRQRVPQPRLLIDADVGMGALEVVNDPSEAEWESRDGEDRFDRGPFGRRFDDRDLDLSPDGIAAVCAEAGR